MFYECWWFRDPAIIYRYIYIYTPKHIFIPNNKAKLFLFGITGFREKEILHLPKLQFQFTGRLHITLRGCSQGIPEVGGTSTTRSMFLGILMALKITGGPCYAIYVPKNKHCKHKKYIIQVDCHHFLANITAVMFAKTTPERDGFKQTLE